MQRIGILGGGQLGSLLTESIFRLGGSCAIYDPDQSAPGCRRVDISFNDSWTSVSSLEKFFDLCQTVTYEFENVESKSLFRFENSKPILPSLQVLKIAQDRQLEKSFIGENNLPHVDFALVNDIKDLPGIASDFGYPFILKTARGGYDGKGQALIESVEQIDVFIEQQKTQGTGDQMRLVLERIIDIAMEVSCIVARSPSGEELCFPVLENVHKEHILDLTILPARISAPLEETIKQIALNTARALGVFGLLTVEFFLSREQGNNAHGTAFSDWHIFINEVAPRPHNSGHITMKACSISQFDALARILLNMPLSQARILAPGYFCMGNLLGDIWLSQGSNDLNLSTLPAHKEVIDVVIYGKQEPRSKRKMGHFITYAASAQAAADAALRFRQSLWRNQEQILVP